MKAWFSLFALGAGFGVAFVAGQWSTAALRGAHWSDPDPQFPAERFAGPADLLGSQPLAAQGRGPVNPGPAKPQPGTTTPDAAPPTVYLEDGNGQASMGGDFLAVTGSYGVGTSVLYLVDTKNRQLAVYEARGGSTEGRRVILVGARRIDLDLQLEKYNDRSEYDYRELRRMFEERKSGTSEVSTGLEPGRSR